MLAPGPYPIPLLNTALSSPPKRLWGQRALTLTIRYHCHPVKQVIQTA